MTIDPRNPLLPVYVSKAIRAIEEVLGDDRPIPEPRVEEIGSGRILVRLPGSLHIELLRQARREGVSLNQFAVAALAGAVEWRKPK